MSFFDYSISPTPQSPIMKRVSRTPAEKIAENIAAAVNNAKASNSTNGQNANSPTKSTTTNQRQTTKKTSFDDDLFLEGFNSARDRDWREDQQNRMQKFGIGMPYESTAQKQNTSIVQQTTSDKLTPEDEKAFLEGFNQYRDEDKAEQAKLQKARQAYADMQNQTPKDTLRRIANGMGIQNPSAMGTYVGSTVKNGDLTPEGERAFLEGFNQYRENVEQPQKIYLQDGSAYDTLYGIDFESLKNSKSLDTASNLLTAASAIPMADTFTNLASIPVDLLRGDYISAGLDLLGVIPFAGEIADVAKTARTADRIIDGVRAADKTIDVVKTADKAVDALEAVDDVTDAARVMDDAVDVGEAAKKSVDFTSFPKTIHEGRQGKHIIGHNNYAPGKSILSIPNEKLEKLVRQRSGTGSRFGMKEVVDFGEIVGKYVDPTTGKTYDTTIGTIHYSKSGVHVVPGKPKDWRY